jgi:hypothetical protein
LRLSDRTSRLLSRRSLALGMGLLMALSMVAAPVTAQDTDLDAAGAVLVDEFIEILTLPDTEKKAGLADFLADEFQIVRANGTRLDKPGYIENPASVFEVEISDVHATESNGVMAVSYILSVSETLDGVDQTTMAPRLSVFHDAGAGEWQIAAHSNFGAIEPS